MDRFHKEVHEPVHEVGQVNQLHRVVHAGRKIVPNTGANATKCFTLATKS